MENLEKQIFDEKLKKQSKLVKNLLFFLFSGMGTVFFLLGFIFYFTLSEIKELAIVYMILGAILIFLGILLYFIIPTKYNYEKYKKRIDRYGGQNFYELNAKIIELEERIKNLEKEKN